MIDGLISAGVGDYLLRSEVQFGQRVALMGMDEIQKGHSFVVASAGPSSLGVSLLMLRIRKNKATATTKKLIIELMNRP